MGKYPRILSIELSGGCVRACVCVRVRGQAKLLIEAFDQIERRLERTGPGTTRAAHTRALRV